ncbi:MAG: SpoIIE family protein phosphatase [Bryobacteraceae bacterium]
MLELTISGPEGSRRKFELKNGRVSLGRSADNQLAYPNDPWLSRSHLAFEFNGDSWFVRDCASHNGTVVNSETITTPHKLRGGDRIYAGHLVIEVSDPDASSGIVSFVQQGSGDPDRGMTIVTSLDKALSRTSQLSHQTSEGSLNTPRVVQALIRAGQELAGHRPLSELFSVILELGLSAMKAKRGVILTLEENGLVVRASQGEGFEISTAVRDRVLRDKCSLVIADALFDESFRKQMSIRKHRVRSVMAVPLQTGDRVIGLMYLDNGDVVRTFQQEDVELLTVLANVAAIRIEHARLAEIEAKEQLMALELSQASEIQQNLLPAQAPYLDGYDIAGLNMPCRTVGGDYYDFVVYQNGRLGLVIGDVAGKGLPAALMMSSLQARVQMLLETQPAPDVAITILNRNLTERSVAGRFITFFYALLDLNSGALEYSNAGHNYPLLLRANGTVEELTGSNMVLGIVPDARYELHKTQMERGDTLALFSDGVTEARNSKEQELGEKGLASFLQNHRGKSAEETISSLSEDVRRWCETTAFGDDFTIVLVKRF